MGQQTWESILASCKTDDMGKWDATLPLGDALLCGVHDHKPIFNIPVAKHPTAPKPMDEPFMMFDEWAFDQFCRRYSLPQRYLRRLPDQLVQPLYKHEIEMHSQDEVLLRSKGNTIRAFLSDSYSVVNNAFLIGAVQELSKYDHEVRGFNMNERGFWLKLLVKEMTINKNGEEFKVGIMFGNSEVGCRVVSVELFIYRKACTNDLVVLSEESIRQRHLYLTELEIKSRVADAIGNCLQAGPEAMGKFINSMDVKILEPRDVIKKLCADNKFSQLVQDQVVLAHETEGAQKTLFGVVNAFTRVAQVLEPDDRIEMERFAGTLLAA